MSHSQNNVPLGAVLQKAGLVSSDQIQQALKQQSQNNENLRIGEILASQGRINPKTADFFAECWSTLVEEKQKQPIGQYLKQAALLDEKQIQIILDEQKNTNLKFGELAIAKGWLKQATVDFFLKYLAANSQSKFNLTTKTTEEKKTNSIEQLEYSQRIHERFLKIKYKLLKLENQNDYSEELLERVLLWTGGQSFLTQTLFRLIGDNKVSMSQEQTTKQVDYLVKTKLLHDWENQEIGKHLKTIEDRLLNNHQCEPSKLLKLYQRILQKEVPINESKEQKELLNIGLVVKQEQELMVANQIYQSVFNQSWIKRELANLAYQNNFAIPIVPETSTTVVSAPQSRASFLKFRNILLLLALISLLSIFFKTMAKRIAVKTAFQNGNELLKQGNFEQAIAEYNRLLKIDSNYFQAWTNRGYALAGLQQYDEMRESCLTATIIEPKALYAWNCQGEALHNLKREKESIVAFERASALNKMEPIFLINKSESLTALGEFEESFVVIQEAIKILEQLEANNGQEDISGEFAVALTSLGNGYRRKEQYAMAVATYDRALEYSTSYFPAQIGKGIVLSRANRHQEAIKEFERILENTQLTETRQAQTWFYLGKTLCKSQLNSEGIAAFEQAIRLNPNYEAAEQAKKRCN